MNDTLIEGQHGRELTAYHTCDALVGSKRWKLLVGNIPIEKIARVSILPVHTWSGFECAQVIDWAAERIPVEPLPKVLDDYMKRIQDQ